MELQGQKGISRSRKLVDRNRTANYLDRTFYLDRTYYIDRTYYLDRRVSSIAESPRSHELLQPGVGLHFADV